MIHSGTVGAALTAGVLEIPAVAVSIGWGEELHWTTAAALTPGALEWAAQREQPAVVNLNLPNVPLSEVRGVREGRLCPFNERWSSTAKTGELTLDYEGYQREPDPGTDLGLVRAGYAAVTVLSGVDAGNATGLAEATARALDARAERAS